MADPRVVKDPKPISTITYRELRELAYMGATVLHDEAIFPVRESGIPVNIRNTNEPDDPGTMIVRGNGNAAVSSHVHRRRSPASPGARASRSSRSRRR